ncbi:unnamed protein product [Protopolystoma xenopodis]|uniref:Uncharacterized protein n=1 Tax=Protopolystoma xenopodis TaxID=117903 RepID=A0A448WKM8_9PLAT|nr:unnamed protein product [Protopolystoma xenopodis]
MFLAFQIRGFCLGALSQRAHGHLSSSHSYPHETNATASACAAAVVAAAALHGDRRDGLPFLSRLDYETLEPRSGQAAASGGQLQLNSVGSIICKYLQ